MMNQIWSLLPGFCTRPTDLTDVSLLLRLLFKSNALKHFYYVRQLYWQVLAMGILSVRPSVWGVTTQSTESSQGQIGTVSTV